MGMTTLVNNNDALAKPRGREAGLVEVVEKTRDYVRAAKARATLRAYQSDWRAVRSVNNDVVPAGY
jgi:hypothetical protein